MRFNRYPHLEGTHAPYSPSQSAWLRYDDEKAVQVHLNKKSIERGTLLHEWAKTTIDLGIKQPRSNKTLYAYVNDAIGFKMKTEVIVYYSPRFYGTVDAISFRVINGRGFLRIHDLKTGEHKAKIEQLRIYAAIFCLEYHINPADIDFELRLYQYDDVIVENPEAEKIEQIMAFIRTRDKLLDTIDNEEV